MRVRRSNTALAAILLASSAALGNVEEDDKLCEVTGDAPNLSVPPKDRLWFKENCFCAGAAGCGKLGSERFTQRLEAVKKAEVERADAIRKSREKAEATKRDALAASEKRRKAAATASEKRRKAEAAAFVPGRTELSKTIDSSGERFRRCITTAPKMAEPEVFCREIEDGFLRTPEGEANHKAEMERKRKDAEMLSRAREACRVFRICVKQSAHCLEESERFMEACRVVDYSSQACGENCAANAPALFKPVTPARKAWPPIEDQAFRDAIRKGLTAKYAGKRTWEQLEYAAECLAWNVEDRYSFEEIATVSKQPTYAQEYGAIGADCKKNRPAELGPDLDAVAPAAQPAK